MDINSLLSPSDSPAGTPTPQPQPPPALPSPGMLQSPSKRAIRQMPSRTPSGLSQQITSSPQPQVALQQVPSPGFAHIANGARAIHSAMSTPQPLGSPHDARMASPAFRQASTPGMDTLAGRFPLLVCGDMGVKERLLVRNDASMCSSFAHKSPQDARHWCRCIEQVVANYSIDLASMQQQQAARQTPVGHHRPVT